MARLLAAGADPNASGSVRTASGGVVQNTALCAAAGNGRLEAVRLLLDAGADPSLADSIGGNPLAHAALNGQLDVLRLLLGRGAAVDDAVELGNGFTAFHSACFENQADCAEALARAGCDVGLETTHGKTGREIAESEGHAAVVERLRALQGARVGAAARVHGLVGAPEHNGQRAAVRRHLPAKGRFELELLGSGNTIHVKPTNFELVIVPVGLPVEVTGMVALAKHTGQHAIGVVESRVGESGHCGVRLNGKLLGLKPACLALLPEAAALEATRGGKALAVVLKGTDAEKLCDAAESGDDPAVARLLVAGADPNALVPRSQTPSGRVVHATALCEAAVGCPGPPGALKRP